MINKKTLQNSVSNVHAPERQWYKLSVQDDHGKWHTRRGIFTQGKTKSGEPIHIGTHYFGIQVDPKHARTTPVTKLTEKHKKDIENRKRFGDL